MFGRTSTLPPCMFFFLQNVKVWPVGSLIIKYMFDKNILSKKNFIKNTFHLFHKKYHLYTFHIY